MPSRILFPGIAFAIGALAMPSAEATENIVADRDVARLYGEFCVACHGENLQGGKARSLLDNEWRHGGDSESVMRNIREGIADPGMPAFGSMLNERELHALAIYVLELAKRGADPVPAAADRLPDGTMFSEEHAFRIERLVEDLDVPWSLAFLPDGRLLFTERTGGLFVAKPGGKPQAIAGVPPVWVRDEGGLLAVAVHPQHAENGWIYLSFADPGENDTGMLKVVRARLKGRRLVEHKTIFSIPREEYTSSGMAFGSRFVFDGDHLFFGVGDRNERDLVQDLSRAHGKIHRVFHDGTIPPDNPFRDTPGALPSIWSVGHRNPQGLARDPVSALLWETEHGPRGGDELNVIGRGANHGWPLVTHGMNYDGTPISAATEAPGLVPPIRHWTPSLAVSPLHFYQGDKFPRWRNQLFMGTLGTQQLRRFVVEGDRIVHKELVFRGLGRVRDVQTGPDGLLYLALELPGEPGYIVRLVPDEPTDGERIAEIEEEASAGPSGS